jgi:hypothetical protein
MDIRPSVNQFLFKVDCLRVVVEYVLIIFEKDFVYKLLFPEK